MTITTIEVRTCERCGATEEMRQEEQSYSWSKVRIRQINAPFAVGCFGGDGVSECHHADVCPACTQLLKAWWKAGGCWPWDPV